MERFGSQRCLVLGIALSCLAGHPVHAQGSPSTLYGIDSNSTQLVTIDTATGAAAAAGPAFGPVAIDGIAFSLVDETFYAVDNTNGMLVSLDPATGQVSAVLGPIGSTPIESLAVHPVTGDLYGVRENNTLVLIGPAGGLTTLGATDRFFTGLAFSPDGSTLYAMHHGNGGLYTLDPGSGAPTLVGGVGEGAGGQGGPLGLAIHPDTGVLYTAEYRSGPSTLAIVSPLDGTRTPVGAIGVFDQIEGLTFSYVDCNGNGLSDTADIDSGTSADCNLNGIPDECDLASGTSADCEPNGVPDECEPDCDGDGLTDACEISSGAPDCDGNTVPDGCQPDCDGDGVIDVCAIAGGDLDCNGNGLPQSCEPKSCIDAVHPSGTGPIYGGLESDRGVAILATRTRKYRSFGVYMATTDSFDFGVSVYEMSGTSTGSLIAEGSIAVEPGPARFVDVPVCVTLQAGTRYRIDFDEVGADNSGCSDPFGCGGPCRPYSMRLFSFNNPTLDGAQGYLTPAFDVLDGRNGCSGFGNTLLPHVRACGGPLDQDIGDTDCVDLGHPTATTRVYGGIESARGVAVEMYEGAIYDTVGAYMSVVEPHEFQVTIRSLDGLTPGDILARVTADVGSGPLGFRDVPLPFVYAPGQRYEIEVDAVGLPTDHCGVNGCGASCRPFAMEFAFFQNDGGTTAGGYQAGPFTVLDGRNGCSGYANGLTPRLRMCNLPQMPPGVPALPVWGLVGGGLLLAGAALGLIGSRGGSGRSERGRGNETLRSRPLRWASRLPRPPTR